MPAQDCPNGHTKPASEVGARAATAGGSLPARVGPLAAGVEEGAHSRRMCHEEARARASFKKTRLPEYGHPAAGLGNRYAQVAG